MTVPRSSGAVSELGQPVAFTALTDGTPVYDRGGSRVGVVEHVTVVGGIFEGLVVHTYPLPGRHVYVRPEQIAEMRERGVLLSVSREDLPDAVPRRRRQARANALDAWVRRAWDRITGQA